MEENSTLWTKLGRLQPFHKFLLIFSVLTAFALACSVPFVNQGSQPPSPETAVAQTIEARDKVATGTAMAQSGQEGQRSPTPASTQEADSTSTQEPTMTPTRATPEGHVSANTNCRTGPGEVYELLGIVSEGQTVDLFAQDPQGAFWYVTNPDDPDQKCWIWGNYVTPQAPTTGLPVYTPRPTPSPQATATPRVSFTVAFHEIEDCVVDNILEFRITNTGDVPLESVSYSTTDQSTGLSKNDQYNSFQEWNHCPVGSPVETLNPGQQSFFVGHGVNISESSDALSGHQFQATITACTRNNLGGRCTTRNLSFIAN